MIEIRWHGRGGQGAKTVAQLLAAAALRGGLWAQAFPEYGPERSGAPVRAFTRLDRREIRLHCGVYQPDIVVVLDPTLLDSKEVGVLEGLKRHGVLVVNSPKSSEELREQIKFSGRIVALDANRLAREAGTRFANVVLLGALAALLPEEISLSDVEEELQLTMRDKPKALEANLAALRAGFYALRRQQEPEVLVC
ncbi:MAG: 2-oxoacid:acceptor oxidoreductase family protein [Candidatus Bipolaricaulota bacterium]|nr:2-oxoacid:acceptor oxidoreductase family protein [Candidatus Bipolaricaulota bacterium]MCS7274090.1 2-oxoacid:acceptor oxidoreductase family protein [Candidatus Bipolaricaulota bacterium]MDW8110687.1 2-oxoacid:acceptor oxidoreductase family protein [Candidatus Bipolaricaulota bacterium]MDW8328455.1 2-oxoacid:acceptor oxidoreductase family protein [Candidatus Bipolaricaulota bacterium]